MNITKPLLKEILIISSLVALIILFIVGLGSSLFHIGIAFFLAYASLPLVQLLEKRGLSRGKSTAIVVATVACVIAILLLIIIPPIISEIEVAITEAPQNFHIILEKIESKCSEFGIKVPYDRQSIIKFISTSSQKISMDLVQSSGEILKKSFLNLMTVVVSILNLFILPVFFIFVIYDYENILAAINGILPKGWRPEIHRLLEETDKILSGFIRGQLIVCLILSSLYSLALLLAGVKFAILIGCLTGCLSCIPYVGFSMGITLALLSALLSGDDYSPFMWTILLYGFVQFCESFLITPKIVGDKVGLSAFESILSLIIFGNLFGFVGLLAAIPCGGISKVIFRDLISEYKKTAFYKN